MKHFLLLSLCLILLNTSFAQKEEKNHAKGSITKEAILDDLDTYRKIICEKHVDPFVCIKRREFYARIKQIKDSADHFNVDEILIKWLQVNAALQDGHTSILYDQVVAKKFPFYCFWYEEGIFITGVSKENMSYQHCKVIAVNGISVEEVARRIATIAPDKTVAGARVYIQKYLFDPFVIHGLGISPSRDEAVYKLITLKGDTVQMRPQAVPKADIKIIIGADTSDIFKPSELYACKYVDSGSYIYFKYESCWDDSNYTARNIIQEVKELIKKKVPKKIIIDLRENNGGYKEPLEQFVDFLTKTDLNKNGKICVLVCRHTYSEAICNAVYCRNYTHAIIIGEKTSGTVAFYGGVQYLSLPATRLRVSYSTGYWDCGERYRGALQPDILVPLTFANRCNKFDATLDYAIRY